MTDDECMAYDQALRTSGRCLASEALEPVRTARTVQVRQGKVAVPDGHFSLADLHGASGANRLKSFRGEASARSAEGLVVSHALIIGHGADFLFFAVDEAEVFQSLSP